MSAPAAAVPPWLAPLPDAERMRATDRWAIEERGVPSLDLMERAGAGLAALVAELAPSGPLAVLCGKGNNGGDGLVAARLLREAGREVRVLLTAAPGELRGDAAAQLERLPGAAPEPFAPDALAGAAAAVDALLGTGFSGAPRGTVAAALDALAADADRLAVVAADVPSGLDASTGTVAGAAVCARATATFHAAKPGLWINPGKTRAGEVRVIDIGIPPGAPGAPPPVGLIGERVLDEIPRRAGDTTKFDSGQVAVIGGSRGLTGAPCLAAEAAARGGAGYVTALVPASLEIVFEQRLVEVMTAALPDSGGDLLADGAAPALARSERAGAVVLGPGLGRGDGAQALARELAARVPAPLLLDADGLNAHAGRLGDLAARTAPAVITPHAGELGRLLDLPSAEIGRARLAHARAAAAASGAVVVLKGDDTLVARPDGLVAVSPGGSPALATAGTGDVLAGLIGALLAKGMDPFAAAAAGVLVHVRAGRIAARRQGGADGVIARDVIAALPLALAAGEAL